MTIPAFLGKQQGQSCLEVTTDTMDEVAKCLGQRGNAFKGQHTSFELGHMPRAPAELAEIPTIFKGRAFGAEGRASERASSGSSKSVKSLIWRT